MRALPKKNGRLKIAKRGEGENMVIAKRIMLTIIAIPCILIFAFISLYFSCPLLNDKTAGSLAKELRTIPPPYNTQILESLSGCGNVGGTGNHTDMWAGILIKTELEEKDVEQFYKEYYIKKVDTSNYQTFAMECVNKEFSNLNNIDDYEGFYIIETVERHEFYSFFDLRGH